MDIKYNVSIDNEAIENNISRLTNQVFKLLPLREENQDWRTPLNSLIVEIAGMSNLLESHMDLFPLLCKLESLLGLTDEDDFLMFRKIIFECLSLMNNLKKCL